MGDPKSEASPLWIWLGLFLFGLLGLVMLMHGLGLQEASWFNPNPDVPRWVFALIGLLLLIAMPLLLNQVWRVSGRLGNLAGYSFFGLAWIIAHWMVFFAEGGSCSLDLASAAIGAPLALCTYIMGAVLLLADAIVLLLLLRGKRRS